MKYGFMLAVTPIVLAPWLAYANSLECHGTIISEGDSEQQLLEACGEPVSRSGADWRYEIPGSLPVVVTLGEGMVMFIREADELPDTSASPIGDHP
ncbi:MAG: DUF2845 domain-containing protein [Gammaproteobacteria bacterium]|jgi:hypothetical protein